MTFYFDIDSIEQKFLHFLRRRFDLKKKKKNDPSLPTMKYSNL